MSGRRALLTTQEVAERLGMSTASVLRRWRNGELPGYRLGNNVLRFSEDDLDAWLSARRLGTLALPDQRSVRDAG